MHEAPATAQTYAEAVLRRCDALAACSGNVTRAARRLGISRSTLYRRIGGDMRRDGLPN